MSSDTPPPHPPSLTYTYPPALPLPPPPIPGDGNLPDMPPASFPMNLYPPPLPGFFFPVVPPPPFPFDGQADKPKRKQVKTACSNCAQACKRCDETRPCMRCRKYGLNDSCADSQRKERKKGTKRGPYKRKAKTDQDDLGVEATATANNNNSGSDDPNATIPPLPPLPTNEMVVQNTAAAQHLFAAFQAALAAVTAGQPAPPDNAFAVPPPFLPGMDSAPAIDGGQPMYPFPYPMFPFTFPMPPQIFPINVDDEDTNDTAESSPSMARLTPPPQSGSSLSKGEK